MKTIRRLLSAPFIVAAYICIAALGFFGGLWIAFSWAAVNLWGQE